MSCPFVYHPFNAFKRKIKHETKLPFCDGIRDIKVLNKLLNKKKDA